MYPRVSTKALQTIPGNLRSNRFPGGSLISGILDRSLMTWSDRGGASRLFGEIWADHAHKLLISERADGLIPRERDGNVKVLRLDDNPKIATQAGRNKLRNPDFLLATTSDDQSRIQLRAIDAKFAVDRVRRSQVSADAVRQLVELSASLVMSGISEEFDVTSQKPSISYLDGAFLGPQSLLNDYFFRSLTGGDEPVISAEEVILIPVEPIVLFGGTPEFSLMERFRWLDDLKSLAPEVDIIAWMYYLRLACAARWFLEQQRRPLLTAEDANVVPAEDVESQATSRIATHDNAFELVRAWSREVERTTRQHELIKDAVRLPVRMGEIKRLATQAGFTDEKKQMRQIRGRLERAYAKRLIEEVGEIPSNPTESITSIIERIRNTNRKLRPVMKAEAISLIERLAGESAASD